MGQCKRTDAPRVTRSIRTAFDDLGLTGAVVLYPGTKRYLLAERVQAVPIAHLANPDAASLWNAEPE